MTHMQLQNNFKKKLSQYLSGDYFYYKIPDAQGGPLRPFDSFLVLKGVPAKLSCVTFFAIEFKVGKDRLKKHQVYFLAEVVKCGGRSLVITDKDNIGEIIVNKILEG